MKSVFISVHVTYTVCQYLFTCDIHSMLLKLQNKNKTSVVFQRWGGSSRRQHLEGKKQLDERVVFFNHLCLREKPFNTQLILFVLDSQLTNSWDRNQETVVGTEIFKEEVDCFVFSNGLYFFFCFFSVVLLLCCIFFSIRFNFHWLFFFGAAHFFLETISILYFFFYNSNQAGN